MKKKLTKQQKTNARNRVLKLINGIKDKVNIPFNYMVVGSIAGSGEVTVDKNGKYDIDIDITFKGSELNAHDTYIKFKKAFKEGARIDESFSNKSRVIRILKEEDFNVDIALVDYYSNPKKIITNIGGSYEWRNK